jgi:predicted molibdopterin-dependent oxidoreductase YjgC
VQRFFAAIDPRGESKPDWWILRSLAQDVGLESTSTSIAALFEWIAKANPDYAGLSYHDLTEPETGWPPVGGGDLYFGGTAYRNDQGVGVKLASRAERGEVDAVEWLDPGPPPDTEAMLLMPVVKLYDCGATIEPSELLQPRLASTALSLNPRDAQRLGVETGAQIEVRWDGRVEQLGAEVDERVPGGVVLLPRSMGLPLKALQQVQIDPVGEREDV